jgi:hypothetical protein
MAKDTSARAPAKTSLSREDAPAAHPRAPRARNGRLENVKLAVALVISIFAAVSALRAGSRPACIDYYQFWVVGRAVGKEGARDVYTDAERQRLGERAWQEAWAAQASRAEQDVPSKRIQAAHERQVLETFSTPWMYTLSGLASTDDYDADQARFEAFSTLAYMLAIAVFGKLLGFSPLGIAVSAWFFTSPWFKPFGDEVIAGNVNRIQVAFLAAFAWIASRERWRFKDVLSGAVLGAAISFKPNLAMAAVLLAVGGAMTGELAKLARQALGMLLGALLAIAISSAYFGSLAAWNDWLRTIPELMSQGTSAGGNYALSRLLLDRFGFSAARALPFFFVGVVALALWIARSRSKTRRVIASEPARALDRERDVLDISLVGLGAAISVLATDLVWLHYFVLCVPLSLFALRPVQPRRSRARWVMLASAILAVSMIALELLLPIFDIPRPSAASPYVNTGALVLVAVAAIDLAMHARGGATASPEPAAS